ncbi:MAG: oligosaccharide flippase family protein [Bacteroidota bacterium]
MSLFKRLAGHTAIYGISSILGRLLNLVLTPLYTSEDVFPPGVYGIFTDIYSWVAITNVILIFGMETAFFRFAQDHPDEKKVYSQAYMWVSLLGSIFLLVGLLGRQLIANGLGYEQHPQWIAMTVGVIFLDVMTALPMARLRYQEKVLRFAMINLINIVLTITLNLVFLFGIEVDLTYVFLANLIASAVKASLASWGNFPNLFRPQKAFMRELIHYGFFIMLAGAAGMLTQMLDRIMLTRIWEDGTLFESVARSGEEMTGLYGAAYKVAILIMLATQAFRYAVEPFYFKEASAKDSPETFAKVFHYYLIAALIGFLVLASFTREIVTFKVFGYSFIGENYWSALPVVPILLLAYVFNGAFVNLSIWFKISKQVRFAILFTGVGLLIVLLGNFLTINTLGYYGSAYTTLAAFAVMSVLVYLVGQRYYPIPYRMGRLLAYLGLMLGAYVFNRWLGPTDGYYLTFVIKAVVCLLAIGGIFAAEKYLPVFK